MKRETIVLKRDGFDFSLGGKELTNWESLFLALIPDEFEGISSIDVRVYPYDNKVVLECQQELSCGKYSYEFTYFFEFSQKYLASFLITASDIAEKLIGIRNKFFVDIERLESSQFKEINIY